MADVVYADLGRLKRRRGKKASSVREKRLRTADGKSVRVLSLDANSATFIDDLTTVFKKNVTRIRNENKKLLGSPDGFRAKK